MKKAYCIEKIGRRGRTTRKILMTATAVFLLFGTTASVLALTAFEGSLNSVSITDSAGNNSAPVAHFTYTRNGDTFSFDASGSSDSDGSITEYKWDFGDGSVSTGVITDRYTVNPLQIVTLTVVDNEGAVSLYQSTINTQPFEKMINFQPADVNIPDGFVVDYGEAYSSTAEYGWTTPPNNLGTRDRNSPYSPDQAYDTMIHVSPTGVWKLNLTNGNYKVTVCMGDAAYPQGTPVVHAEGLSVISGETLSASKMWIEKFIETTITDGELTITFDGSSDPARLAWIKVVSLPSVTR